MTIESATLAAAAAVLARRAGLRSEESMRSRLERCLEEAAQRHSCTVEAFVARLDCDSAALQALLDRLTVQESAFFRDPGQFEALASGVLPVLERPTLLWSAACANGQEPYSLAMLLDASGDTTSKVIASDISTTALERTRRGTYSSREVAGLSDEQRCRYLRRCGSDAYAVVDEIRERVEVLHLNLASDPPPFAPGECPVIFCRNVMIYFGQEQIVRLLDRFEQWMAPDGVLFLGYSESLWQITDRFDLERMGSAFVYRRRRRGARSATPKPTSSTPPRYGRRAPRAEQPQIAERPVAERPVAERPVAARPVAASGAIGPIRRDAEPDVEQAAEPVAASTVVAPSAEQMISSAMAAVRSGEVADAVAAFRQCAYLHPGSVEAHTHLAFALESAGDLGAARRAFSVARSALERSTTEDLESALQGYSPDELARLLDRKLEESR